MDSQVDHRTVSGLGRQEGEVMTRQSDKIRHVARLAKAKGPETPSQEWLRAFVQMLEIDIQDRVIVREEIIGSTYVTTLWLGAAAIEYMTRGPEAPKSGILPSDTPGVRVMLQHRRIHADSSYVVGIPLNTSAFVKNWTRGTVTLNGESRNAIILVRAATYNGIGEEQPRVEHHAGVAYYVTDSAVPVSVSIAMYEDNMFTAEMRKYNRVEQYCAQVRLFTLDERIRIPYPSGALSVTSSIVPHDVSPMEDVVTNTLTEASRRTPKDKSLLAIIVAIKVEKEGVTTADHDARTTVIQMLVAPNKLLKGLRNHIAGIICTRANFITIYNASRKPIIEDAFLELEIRQCGFSCGDFYWCYRQNPRESPYAMP